MRKPGFFFLVGIFIAPYLFALVISKFQLRWPDDFFTVVSTSVLQAFLSAVLSLFVGGIGALGLLRRPTKWEALALAPAIAPSMAIVLGFLTVFPNWKGWSAVAAAHALTSGGLAAVVLARKIRGSFGASLELAWVEGASRRAIWFQGVLPALKSDLVTLGLSIFAASLASFSIPLLLGGSKAVTVEIAIHQAIRFENAWDIAAALSIFQWAMLLFFVVVLRRSEIAVDRRVESESRGPIGRVLGFDFALAILFVAPAITGLALLAGPFLGYSQLVRAGLLERSGGLLLALQGSLVTSTFAGIFTAFVLLAFAMVYPSGRQRRWISSYVAPSVAITGFATLMIGWGRDPTFLLDSLRISIGAAFLFAPVLWRFRWEERLSHLEGQVKAAQSLGAPHRMIALKVLMPQLREVLFWSIGLVSFWMWGDYALGSIAASRAMTLALVAKGLLESYRLEGASLLILGCLLLGGLSYRLISWGGSRVAR